MSVVPEILDKISLLGDDPEKVREWLNNMVEILPNSVEFWNWITVSFDIGVFKTVNAYSDYRIVIYSEDFSLVFSVEGEIAISGPGCNDYSDIYKLACTCPLAYLVPTDLVGLKPYYISSRG